MENHSPAGLTRAARGPWAEHLHRSTGSQGAAFHTEPPQAPTPGSATPYHHPSGPKPGVGPLARMQSPRPCPRHPLGLSPQHRISHTRWSRGHQEKVLGSPSHPRINGSSAGLAALDSPRSGSGPLRAPGALGGSWEDDKKEPLQSNCHTWVSALSVSVSLIPASQLTSQLGRKASGVLTAKAGLRATISSAWNTPSVPTARSPGRTPTSPQRSPHFERTLPGCRSASVAQGRGCGRDAHRRAQSRGSAWR